METTNERNGTFSIFKGKGAAKFTRMPLRRDDRGFVSKPGAILLEAAPSVGKRPNGLPEYDWSQKITFALGVQDITQMLNPKTDKLVHKTQSKHGSNEVMKTLQFKPGEGKYVGTYQMWLSSSEANSSERHSVFVPLDQGEYMMLQRLLVQSVPVLIGW